METIPFYNIKKYGNDLFYLQDDEQKKLVGQLTGKKTVSIADLQVLHRLTGKIPVQVVNRPIQF